MLFTCIHTSELEKLCVLKYVGVLNIDTETHTLETQFERVLYTYIYILLHFLCVSNTYTYSKILKYVFKKKVNTN